ncbi:methyltransferase type 11, partial [Rhizobium ruizarguesonis]
WATTVMGTIARRVDMPAPPPGSPGLFRCAAEGMIVETFKEAGLLDVADEEVSAMMVHDTPERYWDFMTEIAAPVITVAV